MSVATQSYEPFGRFCIACDYSLEGHAPGAVCPECGAKEDPSIVVLYGWFGENNAAATPGGAMIQGLVMVLGVLLILEHVRRIDIMLSLLGALFLAMLVVSHLRRAMLEKPEPTRKLLLSKLGFRQQALGANATVKGPLRRWAEMGLFLVGSLAVIAAAIRFTKNGPAIAGGIGGVMGIYLRAMRQSHLLQKVGGSEALVPWTKVSKVKVSAASLFFPTSELRIRVMMSTRISRREAVADFRWAPTATQADRAIHLLRQWSGSETQIKLSRFRPTSIES